MIICRKIEALSVSFLQILGFRVVRKSSAVILFAHTLSIALWSCDNDTSETKYQRDSGTSGSFVANQATRISSGLDETRLLSSLTDDERRQFCTATVSTLFSASTPERECELEGVETSVLLGEQTVTCEQAKQDCLLSFSDVHIQACIQDLEQHDDCNASIRDGEECSFASAERRPSILPNVTCTSDQQAKQTAIKEISIIKTIANTPECERYVECRLLL